MKEKRIKRLAIILGIVIALLIFAIPAFAADGEENVANDNASSMKAIACAIAIAIPASVGAIAMALASGKASESIARQPEAASEIRTSSMLGLVFIETAIIYALLVVILIIFVL